MWPPTVAFDSTKSPVAKLLISAVELSFEGKLKSFFMNFQFLLVIQVIDRIAEYSNLFLVLT